MDTPAGGGGYTVPGAFQTFKLSTAGGTLTAGQTYTFSCNVYLPAPLAPANNAFVLLQFANYSGGLNNDAGSNSLSTASSANYGNPPGGAIPLATGVWTPISVTETIPVSVGGTNVESIGVYILDINSDTTATFYWDNASLVPEPSTVAMALTGLLGLVAFAKKRRV
jgi:hypothetical protein